MRNMIMSVKGDKFGHGKIKKKESGLTISLILKQECKQIVVLKYTEYFVPNLWGFVMYFIK